MESGSFTFCGSSFLHMASFIYNKYSMLFGSLRCLFCFKEQHVRFLWHIPAIGLGLAMVRRETATLIWQIRSPVCRFVDERKRRWPGKVGAILLT